MSPPVKPVTVIQAKSGPDAGMTRLLAEHRCLSEALYYEARGEGRQGQQAVAEVVFHRMNNGNYGHSICAVVYEGAGRLQDAARIYHEMEQGLDVTPPGDAEPSTVEELQRSLGAARTTHALYRAALVNHRLGNRAEALRLGRALADCKLRWYEEPVVPEDLRGYVEMREKLTMPIDGANMNSHSTPATAGATAYGQISKVR